MGYSSNLQSMSWECDNSIKKNIILKDEITKKNKINWKNQRKKNKKQSIIQLNSALGEGIR